MATWNDQISNLAGVVASESTNIHMVSAVKDIVNKMARINPAMMFMFAGEEKNLANNSYVALVDNNLILRVSRRVDDDDARYRDCTEIPINKVGDYADSGSLYNATTEYPVFYREASSLKILPAVTKVDYIIVDKVVYGTVAGITTGTGTISNFPSGMIPMAVCYAAMQTLLEKMAEVLVQGDLQNIGTMEIDGSSITASDWDDESASQADLENPKTYFSVLRHYINTEQDAELSRAQVEKITAYLSWYQMSMEHNKVNYSWMFERMVELKKMYNEFFLPYAPEQQQEQPQQQASTNA